MRSRNRRRPSAASIHSRSIAGTSHSMRRMRPKADLRGGLAVDPHLPRFAALRPRFRSHARRQAPQLGGDLPAQAFGFARQISRPRRGAGPDRATAATSPQEHWSCPRRSAPTIATGRPSNASRAALWLRKCDRVSAVMASPPTPFPFILVKYPAGVWRRAPASVTRASA